MENRRLMTGLRCSAVFAVGMLALGAPAETYYLLGSDPGSASSMTGAGSYVGWGLSVGGAQTATQVEAGNTYVLPAGTSVRTPNNSGSGFTFAGDQLIFEGGGVNLKHGATDGRKFEFVVDNLLARGDSATSQISCGNWKVTYYLKGTNWVIDTGATLGFGLSADTGDTRAFEIQSTLRGRGTLKLFTNTGSIIKGACNFTLNGDLSGFTGDIDIDGCYKTAVVVSGESAFGSDPEEGTSRITVDGVKNNNNTGGVTLTFKNDYTFGPSRSWNFGSVDGATVPTISVDSSKTVTILGSVGGSVGLKKTGSGILRFAHPNLVHYSGTTNFSGTATISAADLNFMGDVIEHWAPLGTDGVAWDGKTLSLTLKRGLTAASDVYVAYSDSEDGGSIDWDGLAKQKLSASFGSGVTSVPVSLELPEGTTFVRFYGALEAVVAADRWSDVIDMSEYEAEEDPQVKLSDLAVTEPGIAGATLRVNLTGLGTGATAADVFVRYGYGDSTLQEAVVAEERTAAGELPFTLGNLKPNTTYRLYVCATNGLEGGAGRIPEGDGFFEFTTLAEGTGDRRLATSAGGWAQGGVWSQTSSTPGNLILGKSPSFYENGYSDEKTTDSAATDGVFPKSYITGATYFGVGNDCIVAWEFDEPSTVTEIRFFTPNDSGRGKITIEEVFATVGGVEQKISSTYMTSGGTGQNYAYLLPPEGQALANLATAIRIRFSNVQPNSGAYYSEIEVIGFGSGFFELLSAADPVWDGTSFAATLSRKGAASSVIYACYGETYGGDTTNGWEHCEKAGVFPAGASETSVAAIVSEGARYVRFFSERDGWTASFYLPEIPLAPSPVPILTVAGSPTVSPSNALFSATLAALGEGAASASIVASYGTTEAADGNTAVVCSVTAGDFDPSRTLDLELSGLEPKTRYFIKFFATNDLDKVSAMTATFEITTPPSEEDDPDDPEDTVISWIGDATGDWNDPTNWQGGVVPSSGDAVSVSGTVEISREGVSARFADAEIEIGEDGKFTLVAGSCVTLPKLDVTRPVVGCPLAVEETSFGGITSVITSVTWARGASPRSKSYSNLSTERSITPETGDCGFWFRCIVKGAGNVELWKKEFFFSKLPVLYMTTDDGKTPTQDKLPHTGWVFAQGNERWASPYDGTMTIKVRGNTTANDKYPKKPWKLKLDSKAEMFGIARSRHWVLLANYREKSAMRNKLAYDLANEIGSLGMESTWVECFLNGQYQGLYLFGEQIRIAKDRVDIFDWEGAAEDAADEIAAANCLEIDDQLALETQMVENLDWVTSGTVTYGDSEYEVPEGFRNLDISGGYLVESSKEMDEASQFSITSGTLTFEAMVNSPEFLKTSSEMFEGCKTRVKDYLDALASPDGYNAKGESWSQIADTDAMATYLLTLELLGNDDAEKKSRYFYWDVGGPIVFGPVWDFDWGVGNTLVDKNISEPETWRAHNNNPRSFYREWTDDPWFCTRLRTLYWARARDVLARIISEGGEIDRHHDYIKEAAAGNDAKWPVTPIDKGGPDRSFETECTNLVKFLTTRLQWLDRQFADVPTLMESFKKSCLHEYSSRPDLDDLPSNCPYTADTNGLPIVFANAPTNVIARGTALQITATVASNTVETVDVYVNGLKVGESLVPASGSVSAEIPAAALTEAPGDDNCVSLVARDSSGKVVSRNYALVRTFVEGDGYTFYFNGDYAGDQVIAPTGTECVVIFDSASIDGKLVLPDGVKAYLCPTNGTENTVSGIVGEGAHLTLKDFDGKGGSVSLEGADTLIAISNLVVKSGTLDLASTGVSKTKTPVVKVLGHVKQDGGTIDIDLSVATTNQIYGIYVANKDPEDSAGKNMEIIYAEFNGGTFNATVGGWKSAALYINKGSVDATFNDGSTNNVELVGPEARFVNAAGDLNLKGGEFAVAMPEPYASLTNARVFKSDKEIKIKGGHYVVNVPGPGSEIFSAVKDKKDSIITVTDGTFELVADDDCFSAADRIDIQGGLFYAVSLNNDVFDSNGDMLVSGGTIMAYATAAGHEAFDVEPESQGSGVSTFLPHQLTISGGTIFATGGKTADWPDNLVLGEGTKAVVLEDATASAYAEKYLTLVAPATKISYAAKLPTFPTTECAIFATAPGYDGATPTVSATAPTEGSRDFHELYVWGEQQTYQEFLRFHTIYGSTAEGDEAAGTLGDVGEYIVLTNVSDQVVSLAGVKLTTAKKGKDPSCSVVLTDGTVPAYGSVRLDQADFDGKGWTKITNGDLQIALFDATGVTVQSGETSFNLYEQCDGGGAALVAKRFDNLNPLAATTDDWEPSFSSTGEIDVMPGHSAEVAAADAAAAIAAVVLKVEVPTDDKGAAVVEESVYKGYFTLVAEPIPGETGLYTVSAVLDESLVRPVIEKTVAIDVPFTVDTETSEVTIATKKGLYYSLLRGATLGAIETVVDAKLATGETVTLTDDAKLPTAAFYRVAVSFSL